MIETENLTKKFGDITAVDSITLSVNEGEVFGFLGPNGAGKTTFVRMVSCLISRTSGKARIGDFEIGNSADEERIRRIIGILPENVGLYEELSAYDNLDFYGRLYRLGEQIRREQIERFLKMLGLWERRNAPVATYSKGMKQKLAIARALVHEPRVLFLDEPTSNLDPEAAKTVRDFILDLKSEGRTIFMNTHMLDEAERICDRVAIVKTKLIAVGSPQELRQSLSGRRVRVQVHQLSEPIIAAVKDAGYKVEIEGQNAMVVSVNDFAHDNPAILKAVQDAGGSVEFMTETSFSLEDVYMKLVRGE
ncbi:MAG: ABC transporter ATP-binding protein [Nitrososphaerota archaeon]|nr:ABC transporter ATP-binding protein [Nitrososphaerota archaeon]MDG6931026.1 ABC transporter ATP-binding protein [Nitrososphaerota archaeon]MDG6932114.1 ABC transporter ATP-binding protein [Nitrososphaerota archaeon]MDG6936669.1 ABC transporter ATP-binding protein [Nitrososphaerota archaeon]MDG6944275.1 ABC transporter ATP-binding protein [Nitrososphaerota archaeon]